MAQPWQILDKTETPDGILELRKRGENDYLIMINNRVLMNSSANRSEIVLGEQACKLVASRKNPLVLIGGLGMALTLRAALDSLPASAQVVVAELNPVVVSWCRGPLAGLTKNAASDPRVTIVSDDVARVINQAARAEQKYDAIIIDLYEGPGSDPDAKDDPFYGNRALMTTAAALAPGGVFAVWGEITDTAFVKRLAAAGFSVERLRPGKGGLRHVIYVARLI
ncbi:MAG TPA: spermidine synthase [Nitrospirota bacterium]|nr:spermidine synthase [Nitrospirota bacterium]